MLSLKIEFWKLKSTIYPPLHGRSCRSVFEVENYEQVNICRDMYIMCALCVADINECIENDPCNQTCTNTVGSFMCGCTAGWRLVGQTTCEG